MGPRPFPPSLFLFLCLSLALSLSQAVRPKLLRSSWLPWESRNSSSLRPSLPLTLSLCVKRGLRSERLRRSGSAKPIELAADWARPSVLPPEPSLSLSLSLPPSSCCGLGWALGLRSPWMRPANARAPLGSHRCRRRHRRRRGLVITCDVARFRGASSHLFLFSVPRKPTR